MTTDADDHDLEAAEGCLLWALAMLLFWLVGVAVFIGDILL